MSLKNVLYTLSGLLAIVGFLMLIIPLTDLLIGDELSYSFLLLGIALVISGYVSFKKAQSLTVIESFLVASLAWLVIPTLSALVLMIETKTAFVDAFFESMSGFTGTGFTVLTSSTLKKSILIWRALMQWTGELGIVVFAMIVIPYFYETARAVYGLERPIRIGMNLYETAKRLILVYSILTLLGFVSYVVTGLTPFDAITHIMTTIATGGMSTYNEGYDIIYAYSPNSVMPFIVFMILGALNFVVLYNLVTGNFREVFKSEELRCFIFVLIVFSVATGAAYYILENRDFLSGFFNQVSGMSTTGFSIGSLKNLKNFTKSLLILGMFFGGMTFSTAGGIKTLRLLLFLKKLNIYTEKVTLPPSVVKRVVIQNQIVSDDELSISFILIILYAMSAFIISSLITLLNSEYSFIDSLFETVSALSCVGLSVEVITPTAPLAVKILLILAMYVGRLEFTPILVLRTLIARRKR
ncbi:MAG: potassium transporter TrkG [Desulfurococcaceae archaeon TW002]